MNELARRLGVGQKVIRGAVKRLGIVSRYSNNGMALPLTPEEVERIVEQVFARRAPKRDWDW